MLRASPFRPFGSVLEALPAVKSFLDPRSAGTCATDMDGRSVITTALRMRSVRRLILVVMSGTLRGVETVSRPGPPTPSRRAYLDTATSRRLGLPLLLWRRGPGRGGRHAGRQLLPLSATAFVPSPTLSPRSAVGERENRAVAMSRCAPSRLSRPGAGSGQRCRHY